jgi:hypothetical protein
MNIWPLSRIVSTVTATVTVSSFVCNFLPKSTVFADYPRVKKAYETSINFIIAIAFNWRQCMPSLNQHIPGLGFEKPEKPGPV